MLYILFISLSFLYSNSNLVLLNQLKESEGWVLIKNRTDSIRVYEKNITDMNLKAFKVKKIVSINPENILNTVMNINKYPDVMSNSDMVSFIIGKKKDYIYAYNHFSIPIPFIDNRHYIFKIQKSSANQIEWLLIDDNKVKSLPKFKKIIDDRPGSVYIDYGAGIWNVRKITDNLNEISYALYMDSGGSLSDYLNDLFASESIIELYKGVLNKSKGAE